MYHNARQAYESGQRTTGSSRELEAAVLAKAARQLEECQTNWDGPARAERLRDALRYNQRLWTVFQTELARPDHELELPLRVNLLQLSAFVDRRTFELMATPERDKLSSLIDINRHLAAGLATRPDPART